MKSKLLAGLVAALFLVVSIFAGGLPAVGASGKSLEQAIKIAKSSFTVPSQYTEFTSRYSEYGETATWWLNWRGETGEMSIEVDAVTGEVLRMYHYPQREAGSIKLPKLSYQEAKAIADETVGRLQPDRVDELVLKADPSRPSLDVNPWSPPSYGFRYERTVKGIPYPDNGINITVNGDTGEILNYTFDWYKKELVVPDKLLSQEEAQQIFKREFPLELMYFRTVPDDQKEKPDIKLVFKLRDPGLVRIDPVTGRILEPEPRYIIFAADGVASRELAAGSAPKVELTPEEIAEIAKIKNLIDKEKAAAAAAKVMELSSDYKLQGSSLQKLWQEPDRLVWQLSWQAQKGEELRGYASAAVDGETGEILSFYRYRYESGEGQKEPEYDYEQCRELAWELINKLQPEKAAEVRIYELKTARQQEKARSYRFVYERMVNGIPFPQNGFEVSVNAVTGQVESYNMNWSKAEFPAPDTVIDAAQATEWYSEEVPLRLEFVTSYDRQTGEPVVRLLYHLGDVPYTMLDGVAGTPLNWQGKPFETTKPAVFADLENHPAKSAVELLAAAGVIEGTEDGKFYPDRPITQGELAKILSKLENRGAPIIPLPMPRIELDPAAWYTSWITDVLKKGLLKPGEVDPEATVTRELLAATLIRYTGLEKAAALPEIYKVPFADGQDISREYTGHAVLADALGIVPAVDGKFLPQNLVTRGEAAIAVVKALQSD
ncbi:MAG TPA: hypothetical protein GXX34_12320 [Clostridia bacterium]|nr:hypothetical protein [Clostridia bacterium]